MKKKILYVGNCKNVHFRRWFAYFRSKADLQVLTSRNCSHKECRRIGDFIPYRLRKLSLLPKIGFVLRAYFLRRFLQKNKFDLVHIHSLFVFEVKVGLSNQLFPFPCPTIISVWGSDILSLPSWAARFVKRVVLQKTDLVTATSKLLASETKKVSPGIKRIEIVPFGVDLKIFDPRKFKKPKDGVLRIGFFKHLKPIYGPDYLIKSFKVVLQNFPKAELFLAGEDRGIQEDLEKLATKLGVSGHVHFLGFVENVPKLMSQMDITVMPSLQESFGVAALESQALEVPVIASRVGGTGEVLLDNKTGFLVPPGDTTSLSNATIKLLSSKKLREDMGKLGREFVVKNYDWEKNSRKMEDLYQEMFIS